MQRLQRAPLPLFEAGRLHGLFGVRWILVATRGRTTGRPQRVLLDVLGRDARAETFYVQPAHGRGADWLRNAAAAGTFEAQVGGRRFRARLRDASGPEGDAALLAFVRRHPLYSRIVATIVGRRGSLGAAALARWLAIRFPVIAIEAIADEIDGESADA
ncbi:MAG: hypothetical protein QOD06_973 [Candidatus Binatota bacterium]|jgi:deazaflavin-dependent oxidoreductase (nitroreductase family)|nr:hypothetical protein [Candidatus Binatota bacterium]